ncbi:hypothetical protein E2320_011831, partial [Naja naja]
WPGPPLLAARMRPCGERWSLCVRSTRSSRRLSIRVGRAPQMPEVTCLFPSPSSSSSSSSSSSLHCRPQQG